MPCGAGESSHPHHHADDPCEEDAQEDLSELAPWLIGFRRDLEEQQGGADYQRRGHYPEQGRQEGPQEELTTTAHADSFIGRGAAAKSSSTLLS
ncbi:MAG: hypothetical protein H0T99_14375 [Geodermatophilaceae bacterium]|nr:hypothetical protein [Geodermatophilaceae bacterium]